MFKHKDRDLRVLVHGDDFTVLGWESDLDWFRDKIASRFDVKFRGRMGKGEDTQSIRILNRIVTWYPDRVEYEADQRHAK